MKNYSVEYTSQAEKELSKLDEKTNAIIRRWIEKILRVVKIRDYTGKLYTANYVINGVIVSEIIELFPKFRTTRL